jgi:hypothetical protein
MSANTLTTITPNLTPRFSLQPTTYEQAIESANMFAKSGMVPKLYENQPNKIIVAWELGGSLGLGLMQSLQGIAVINGMPTVWGDTALAIVRASGLLEEITETIEGKVGDGSAVAHCVIKRRGQPATSMSFSFAEAKQAGLAGKAGVWTQYPKRMLQMRARGFALRDAFADVLRGFKITEEVQDYSPKYPGAIDIPQNNQEQINPDLNTKEPAKFNPKKPKVVEQFEPVDITDFCDDLVENDIPQDIINQAENLFKEEN